MKPDTHTTAVNKDMLIRGLRQLGIRQGDIVAVHSSLSRFGRVDGGANTVVAALMETVSPGGSLIMPSYTAGRMLPLTAPEIARGIIGKVQAYDESYRGPTCMGAVADAFRDHPETTLGAGGYRVCAWGAHRELLSEGFHRLLEFDGSVLHLGVGIHACSCMHQVEGANMPADIVEHFEVPGDVAESYPDDIYISYRSTPGASWYKIERRAERHGLISRRVIGEADCMYFKAKPVTELYRQALIDDPYTLFDIKK